MKLRNEIRLNVNKTKKQIKGEKERIKRASKGLLGSWALTRQEFGHNLQVLKMF